MSREKELHPSNHPCPLKPLDEDGTNHPKVCFHDKLPNSQHLLPQKGSCWEYFAQDRTRGWR